MIVTDSTLNGYTVVNGSWGLQLALLIGTIYLNVIFRDPTFSDEPISDSTLAHLNFARNYLLFMHALLTVVAWIAHNHSITNELLKSSLNFLGMFLYIYGVLQVSITSLEFPAERFVTNVNGLAIIIWFRIEFYMFTYILVSNGIFLTIRGCTKHKVIFDILRDEQKLPGIDTI